MAVGRGKPIQNAPFAAKSDAIVQKSSEQGYFCSFCPPTGLLYAGLCRHTFEFAPHDICELQTSECLHQNMPEVAFSVLPCCLHESSLSCIGTPSCFLGLFQQRSMKISQISAWPCVGFINLMLLNMNKRVYIPIQSLSENRCISPERQQTEKAWAR